MYSLNMEICGQFSNYFPIRSFHDIVPLSLMLSSFMQKTLQNGKKEHRDTVDQNKLKNQENN